MGDRRIPAAAARAATPVRKSLDSVQLEVMLNAVTGAAEEMLLALIRSSYSPNIKQRGDCSAAILGANGDVIAQALGAPVHLGSMLGTVGELLKRYPLEDLHPGDVFMANDPYAGGGQHLPDVNVIAPVFYAGRCRAFVANIAHHADMGGMVPGSEAIVCRSIYQEGLRLPLVRLARGGKIVKDVLSILLLNTRTPDEREGDIRAQLAATVTGTRRLEEVYEKYGVETVGEAMAAYLDYTERRFRRAMAELPDGTYVAEDFVDPDIFDAAGEPIPVRLALTKTADRLHLDFSGTGHQAESACNAPINAVLSTVYVMLKTLLDPELPGNSGYFRAVDVRVPVGTILNPRPGAAIGSRIYPCAIVGDVVARALSEALPSRALAGSGPHLHVNVSGLDHEGRTWVDYETVAGAYGARAYRDGMDAVRVHMSGTLNLPIEALEHAYPLRIERYGLRTESGGHGRYRGGMGIVRDYRMLAPVHISISGIRQQLPARGLAGGSDGAPGEFRLNPGTPEEQRLPFALGEFALAEGSVLSIRTPGGGGFGDPRDRPASQVLDDIRNELLTASAARDAYGVARDATSTREQPYRDTPT